MYGYALCNAHHQGMHCARQPLNYPLWWCMSKLKYCSTLLPEECQTWYDCQYCYGRLEISPISHEDTTTCLLANYTTLGCCLVDYSKLTHLKSIWHRHILWFNISYFSLCADEVVNTSNKGLSLSVRESNECTKVNKRGFVCQNHDIMLPTKKSRLVYL